jgi:type IV pilus assembly protein PilM
MALGFLTNPTNRTAKKPDRIVAIDLGNRVTKAVDCRLQGDKIVLSSYAVMDAPLCERQPPSVELLTEHLRAVTQATGGATRNVALAIGPSDSILRLIQMPVMPVEDMRLVLRNNTRGYLQQDLPNHVFDCHLIYQAVPVGFTGKPTSAAPNKTVTSHGHLQRLIAAGAKSQYVSDISAAGAAAKLQIRFLTPALVCPANSFERAMPEQFQNDTVALIDIGFKQTSISILEQGEMVLSRTLNFGGDRLTTAIAEELKISYNEAEGIKIGMTDEVRSTLLTVLTLLGRELRATIDYFEHQRDLVVARALVSGGSACSPQILQMLQDEIMTECILWNPTAGTHLLLSPVQMAEIEQVAPQLGVAIGVAIAAL